MSTLISSAEHVLAVGASDTVKVAQFVETSVLPLLKNAQTQTPTIEAVTSLVGLQAANIGRVGLAALGGVINAIDAAGVAAGGNGFKVTLGRAALRGCQGHRGGG
jgi:hypothetical protein